MPNGPRASGTAPQRVSKHPVRVQLELFAERVELRKVFDGRHEETVDGGLSVGPDESEEAVPDPQAVSPYSSRRRLMSSNTVEP